MLGEEEERRGDEREGEEKMKWKVDEKISEESGCMSVRRREF